jgi:hypothetical protein
MLSQGRAYHLEGATGEEVLLKRDTGVLRNFVGTASSQT